MNELPANIGEAGTIMNLMPFAFAVLALSYTPPTGPTAPFEDIVPVSVKLFSSCLCWNADIARSVNASPALGPETFVPMSLIVYVKLYIDSFTPTYDEA